MILLPGSESGPLTVTLQPCGSFLGRAIDAKGMPRPNVRVDVSVDAKPWGRGHQSVRTDSDGRFRITGLLAGLSYALYMEDAPGPHHRPGRALGRDARPGRPAARRQGCELTGGPTDA